MNIDGLTQRLRARFLGRVTDHEEVDDHYNRARLRAAGIQGSKGSITFKDGQVTGKARGKFLGANGMPSILIPHAPGWEMRMFTRLGRQTARSRRTARRMRATNQLD